MVNPGYSPATHERFRTVGAHIRSRRKDVFIDGDYLNKILEFDSRTQLTLLAKGNKATADLGVDFIDLSLKRLRDLLLHVWHEI